DADDDRVRRQVPHHRHSVHACAGPSPSRRSGVSAGTARAGPDARGAASCGRAAGSEVTGFAHLAAAGPLLVAVGVSILAGLVSFASPCVVPLVPGYLSYLAAVVGADNDDDGTVAVRTRVAGSAVLFVAGFTAVFVLGTVAALEMT